MGDLIEYAAWRRAEQRRAMRQREERQAEQQSQRDRYQRRLTLGEILGDEDGPGPYGA